MTLIHCMHLSKGAGGRHPSTSIKPPLHNTAVFLPRIMSAATCFWGSSVANALRKMQKVETESLFHQFRGVEAEEEVLLF